MKKGTKFSEKVKDSLKLNTEVEFKNGFMLCTITKLLPLTSVETDLILRKVLNPINFSANFDGIISPKKKEETINLNFVYSIFIDEEKKIEKSQIISKY